MLKTIVVAWKRMQVSHAKRNDGLSNGQVYDAGETSIWIEKQRKTYLDRHALGALSPDVDPDCTNAPNQVTADGNDQKADNLWKNSQHVNYTPRKGRKYAFVVITTANPSHP